MRRRCPPRKNKAVACYKNKVIKNWDAISLIFSRDYATSEDESVGMENAEEMALKGAEDVQELMQNSPSTYEPSSQNQVGTPTSTQPTLQARRRKRFRIDDALFCMSGNIKNSFQISVKPNEPPEEPANASSKEIFVALQEIPNLGRGDLLRAYCILTSNDRKFESLVALPMDMRRDWLMLEIIRN
ncbi:hypothetical protein ZWY2020_033713 [Hordeum vulgare]|nr:hypothetical protein ZWY2020_033713 [Hordeum vulgare]